MLLPASPGCVSLPVVVGVPRHSWLRVPGAVPRHSWLGFAVGGGGCSSPLLAEGPGCGSRPLLAGVRLRRWCVVCGVWCVVCGVRRWCVGGVVAGVWCGWSLATPGGGSCVLLPASPGWVSLPVVVGVPRHSWLRVAGAVSRHSWLGSAGGGGVRLPATPGWGPPVVVVCFAVGGVPCCLCLWCVWVCAVAVLCCVLRVCGVCVVAGVVWWCGGCVFCVCWCVWLCVCGVPVVCGLVSPPLATPGRWPWAWFPATPGWGPLVSVLGALGALLLGLGVCVCAVWPFVLVWVAWGGSCAVWLPCVCVCVLAVSGWWGVSYLGWFSSSVGMVVCKKQKRRSCRRVAELRGMRDAY